MNSGIGGPAAAYADRFRTSESVSRESLNAILKFVIYVFRIGLLLICAILRFKS